LWGGSYTGVARGGPLGHLRERFRAPEAYPRGVLGVETNLDGNFL